MKRLWGIRHLRWLWWSWRVQRWVDRWGSVGLGIGLAAESDRRFLQAIWDGTDSTSATGRGA